MGFANVRDLVDAELNGQGKVVSFRKVPAVVTVAGSWYDYSMSPGTPTPQYYAAAPLTAAPLTLSDDGGINHGGAVSPLTKYLRKLMVMNVTAGGVPQRMYLCDYIAYVPFIDMGTTDPQVVLNPAYELERHATGAGVQMMAVLVAPHGLAGDTFFVTYTNQDGTAGRVTPLHTMTTSVAVNGTILTTATSGADRTGPFMALQGTDSGVRSIQSIQCTVGIDVGLFTLVLVKPLADISIRGIDAAVEVDYFVDKGGRLPVVEDDAYLNFIAHPAGSLNAAATLGLATFVWN